MAEVNELFPGQLELQAMIERTKRAQLIYAPAHLRKLPTGEGG